MKLKTQDTIRAIELCSYLGILIVTTILKKDSNIDQVREIVKFLEDNNINLNEIRSILLDIYTLDYISSFRRETYTTEYKKLKCLYDQIIKNTGDFYKELGTTDPISIFATYVYMYRSGYFSHNKEFLYSTNMKDFAKMNGLDIIRGRGVCRSISGMLTDIYKEMGMSSYNLTVKAVTEDLEQVIELSDVKLIAEEKGKRFSKIISLTTKYLPLANHMITMVEENGRNYIFDPTNDGFLKYYNNKQLQISGKTNYFMKNYTFGIGNAILNLLGQYSDGLRQKDKKEQIKLPTVSETEYEKKYLEALKICLENRELFELFYQENIFLIEGIYTISKDQNGLIRRIFPIIPNKKQI